MALDVTVESLAADVHGRFDVAFSVNVLEHLESAIGGDDVINSVMAPGGVQGAHVPELRRPVRATCRDAARAGSTGGDGSLVGEGRGRHSHMEVLELGHGSTSTPVGEDREVARSSCGRG